MPNNSYADFVKHWGELTTAVAANPELAHLEWQRSALESELEGFKDASVRQAQLQRQAQEASIELSGYIKRGKDMATRLRDGIRGHYGRAGERLVEYRLQPRRVRKPAPAAPTTQEDENEKPSEMGPNPAQTAAPVTDASMQE